MNNPTRGAGSSPRVRLSLRAAMVIVLFLAIGLGSIVTRARDQQNAVAAIKAAGGSVDYDWQYTNGRYTPNGRPRGPKWLREGLGPHYLDAAVTADLRNAFTDVDISHIGRLDRLKLLHLGGRFTDSGLVHLERLKKLQILILQNALLSHDSPTTHQSRITDAGVVHLKDLCSLEELAIGSSALTNAGLASLASLTNLTSLDIDRSYIGDLAPICTLTGLQVLRIRQAPLDDTGLAPVAQLGGLLYLDLHGTQITGGGLTSVSGLARLRWLKLSRTPITDSGLANLTGPASLGTLDLSDTQITDAGLKHLGRLTGLRVLAVKGTGVTDTGIAVLRRALRQLGRVIR